jgi:hypothetical protein
MVVRYGRNVLACQKTAMTAEERYETAELKSSY